MDELEEKLLREIQRNLHNSEADQASLEQSAAIMKAADTLVKNSIEPVEIPAKVAR